MTTYNTGNPIGSKDPRDLYDNAENMDAAVNDTESGTWVDRFGRHRLTWKGIMESGTGDPAIAVDAANRALGYADDSADAANRASGYADDSADSANRASGYADDSADSAQRSFVDANRSRDEANRAESASDLAVNSSNVVWRQTRSQLNSVSPGSPNTPGVVYGDSNPDNNGYYIWNDSSWSKTALQPVDQESIGEFGVSANFVHDWNTIGTSGFYRSNPTGQAPIGGPLSSAHMHLQHFEGTSGRAHQIVFQAYSPGIPRSWIRSRTSASVWTDWVEIITDKANSVKNQNLPVSEHNTDWDAIAQTGWFRSPNTNTEYPWNPWGAVGNLLVMHQEGFQGRARQLAFRAVSDAPGAQVRTRARLSDGTWEGWVEIPTSGAKGIAATDSDGFYVDGDALRLAQKEASNWNAASTEYFTNSVQLNNLYKALETEFPDYVSSELLGTDDFANEIWEFKFTPPGFRWIAPATPTQNAHPKIVVVTGVHGSESTAMISSYLFFSELCRNWQRDEALSDLRWGCEIVVVPCLNPWGLNNGNSRRNGNNVDFNHNMPWGWDDLVSDYKGPEPLSEPESVIAHNLPVRHPTAQTFIDFHAHTNDYITWVGTRAPDGFAIQKHMLRKHQAWIYRNVLYDRPENTSLVASSGTAMSGIATDWTYTYNKKGFLLETHLYWPTLSLRNRRRMAVDSLKRLIHENWRVESESGGWIDGPPGPPEGYL